MSLHERLGGSPAITAVVQKFYQIMLKDERVAHYFANTNMSKQTSRQISFITLVTGGANNYEGADMKTAHCKHSIGHHEFDATWENLQKALHFFNVPSQQLHQLKQILYSVQAEIVNKIETKESSEKTLYEKLGGHDALSLVVNKFYDLMLKDSKVSHYFSSTNMQKQRNNQIEFIAMVTGGPNNYIGKDMKSAHCPYKIGHLEFDATWEHLETALKTFSVRSNLIQQVKDVFYSVEGEIVTESHAKTENSIKGKCPFHKQPQTPKVQQKVCPQNFNQTEKKVEAQSLYDRLGGNGAVYLVVNKFYDIMVEDPRVKAYFTNTDMEKQKSSQIEFISMVTGGPKNYRGKDMKAAHCPYKIRHFQFDATWENLEKAFIYFQVNPLLVNEVRQIFYSVQGQIVNYSGQDVPKIAETNEVKEISSQNAQFMTITSQGIVPVTQTLQQPTNQCPHKNESEREYQDSQLMKCPHMAREMKEIETNCNKLSQCEKRKLRQQVIHKEEESKQVKKLNNNPYQKTYY